MPGMRIDLVSIKYKCIMSNGCRELPVVLHTVWHVHGRRTTDRARCAELTATAMSAQRCAHLQCTCGCLLDTCSSGQTGQYSCSVDSIAVWFHFVAHANGVFYAQEQLVRL